MECDTEAFLRVLDPADTSTGGGTASAIAGAMAAALVAMVARLPVGKDAMNADGDAACRESGAEAEVMITELLQGGVDDARAFGAIRAAYRLPKATTEQKIERSRAIRDASIQAANVPRVNAECCRRVLEICAQLHGHSNPAAASDLECARHLARAALLGCVANIVVNLPSIKDQALIAELAERAEVLRTMGNSG